MSCTGPNSSKKHYVLRAFKLHVFSDLRDKLLKRFLLGGMAEGDKKILFHYFGAIASLELQHTPVRRMYGAQLGNLCFGQTVLPHSPKNQGIK